MDPHTHSPHPQLKYFLTIHIVLKVRSSLYHESIRVIYSIMLVIPPPSPFSLPRSPFSPLPYRCAIMSTPSLASPSCPVRLSVSISTQIRCVPDALAAYGYGDPRVCSRTAEVSRRTLTGSRILSVSLPSWCPRFNVRCKPHPALHTQPDRWADRKTGRQADRQNSRHTHTHTHSHSPLL